MLVQFSASASDLHRVCVSLAAEMEQLPEIADDPVHFNITPKGLEITLEGASANLKAEVRNAGAASVPFTVVTGVLHMLPYFGENSVQIAFSPGKMRVDTTVFHNRRILLAGSHSNECSPLSLQCRAPQPA